METTITKELLDSFDFKIGQQFAVYDVVGRKVYFFVRNEDDYRLKLIRGKRRLPMVVKPSDGIIRINYNGSIERDRTKIHELVTKS